MAMGRYDRTQSGGKKDNFGNDIKNIFMYANEYTSKKGVKGTAYKGYLNINGTNYSIDVNGKEAKDNKGRKGVWCRITEYQGGGAFRK